MAVMGEDIRTQDATRVIVRVAQQPAGTALAWNFLQARWRDIKRT